MCSLLIGFLLKEMQPDVSHYSVIKLKAYKDTHIILIISYIN